MPKGGLEDTRVATRMEDVREQIRALEIGIVQPQPSKVLDLLRLRSEIEVFLAEQEALGCDVRAERTRLETVDNQIDRQAVRFAGALAARGGLRAARQAASPPREHWWWYLDELAAERTRRSVVRVSALLIGGLLLFLLANYLFNTFFGMDPEQREAYGYTTQAEQRLFGGDYQGATEAYEQAVAIMPDMAEAWLALAALYDHQGREADAQAALARAEQLIGDPLRLLLLLARQYEMLQDLDQALILAQQAVELDPQSAEAYLTRGGILEGLGERERALADFELASELAHERGEDALYVLARTRMGMLMQQGDAIPLPGSLGQ